MLQYITDSSAKRSVEDQIKDVLAAGCGWITIDPAGITDDEIKSVVEKVMPECIEKQAFLILKDKVQLAKEINVGGVVLSQGSEFPSHARMTLGAAAVIGVEVSTKDQISALQGLDVDYVVMNPYKTSGDTDVKALGTEGIKELCSFMENKQMELPRVAAGGVAYEDISSLMDAGCNGVAMSEFLADATDIAAETKNAIALLKKYEEKELAKLNVNS
ncbi:MAG: thiamine phosphate synthase [Muribaculaceae bacterium]|nr:thiamine phosphate synthase [Muribaculaceae bacterium]